MSTTFEHKADRLVCTCGKFIMLFPEWRYLFAAQCVSGVAALVGLELASIVYLDHQRYLSTIRPVNNTAIQIRFEELNLDKTAEIWEVISPVPQDTRRRSFTL